MKQIAVLAMLIMAGVLAHGQTLVDVHTAKPDNPPLKCEKYQHEQKTPAHCAETCPPYGVACTSQCLYVAADDRCVDDIHMVTEREWQEVLAKLKELQPKK